MSREWLSAEVRRLGSIAAVAGAHRWSERSLRVAARRLGVREPRPHERVRPEVPLYFDEGWLRAGLARYGSYWVLSARSGYERDALHAYGELFGLDAKALRAERLAVEGAAVATAPKEPRTAWEVTSISEAWLRSELAKYRTLTGVAENNGFRLRDVASAVEKFGINVQREYWAND